MVTLQRQRRDAVSRRLPIRPGGKSYYEAFWGWSQRLPNLKNDMEENQ
jgi:hypothetical protein